MYLVFVFIGFFWVYLLINIGRLFRGRINKEYLRHAWRRTAVWLLLYQVAVLALTSSAVNNHLTLLHGIYILSSAQLVFSFVILLTYQQNLKRATIPTIKLAPADHSYPTLSVCIPARNETNDLEECLQSLIASKYPKLEILVLDDQSQERRTSEIIRGFAHDGVRFIAGETPPDKWLAKNYAYEQLASQANGEVLLFCGVDCRFEPETLDNLVLLLEQTNASMLSVLPSNQPDSSLTWQQTLIQPARYAWELALPRQFMKRPPVLSTAWVITATSFKEIGGFAAVTHKVVPESYFAKQLSKNKQTYQLIIANDRMKLNSNKTVKEQRETAIRTRYPQLHRRPELVALVSLAELAQLLLPIWIFIFALLSSDLFLAIVSMLATIGNTVVYSKLVNLTYRRSSLIGIFALPVATIYDICLLNYSMWQYEFGVVKWKERNIAFPVMQTFPSLPKLSD